MRITRLRWALAMVMLLIIIGSAVSRTLADSHDPSCVARWYELSESELVHCENAVGNRMYVFETLDAMAFATIDAIPTVAGNPNLATEVAFAATLPTSKPTPQKGEIPSTYMIIRELSAEEASLSMLSYKYNTSAWRVGAIIGTSGYAEPFFVTSREGACFIDTYTAYDDRLHEYQIYRCPDNFLGMRITDVTDPEGVVTFAINQSDTGTFDLRTHTWTLQNKPWIPALPARNDPPPMPYP